MDWMDAEILQVVDETPRDRSLVLGLAPDARKAYGARPGQHLFLEASEGESGRGAYSISALPRGADHLQVTIRNEGELGQHFYALPVGTSLKVSAPRGRFVLETEPGRPTLLFAYGPSIVPYRAFVRALREKRHEDPVALVHEVDEAAALLFASEFERHAGELGWFDYHPRIGDPVDRAAFEAVLGEASATRIFVCGRNAFVDRIRDLARDGGVPDENVLQEKWG